MKKLLVILVAIIAAIYLVNPGAGVFELIPDNLPLVGNLDEAAAAALLLGCLRYFGIDLTGLFRGRYADRDRLDRDPSDRP